MVQIQIHHEDICSGSCPFHDPSDHHMRDWKWTIRMDRADKLVERICPCGVGHPDPDSYAHLKPMYGKDVGVHGCCGCCKGPID